MLVKGGPGNWNIPTSSQVNIMAADALAPCLAMSSTVISDMQYHDQVFIFKQLARISTTCAISVMINDKKLYFSVSSDKLTLKHREMHGCVVSTVATDALVLKHQAICILSTDLTFSLLD